ISNHSSGRMGFAVASRAMKLGAKVTIIHGQVDVPPPGADVIREVKSASQMKTAVLRYLPRCDVLVMAAAVSDFRPTRRAKEKIKKETGIDSIELVKTADILLAVRDRKKSSQIIVGFALETADGEKNAVTKSTAKGCDYMVLNMAGMDTGFGTDTNQVTLFKGTEKLETSPLASKDSVAGMIVDMLAADGRLEKAKR
ncbi:MAG: phosphopantothenoylcysteine decarboxylase, partial [Bacteroidales bacterium]|nr:phosphopantothenoylcysteine decarboxylase [Candidatus Latescibacterota bacterium]